MEEIESGISRVVIEPELQRPSHHRTAWTKCYVLKKDKSYLMYTENSNRFLLAALLVGDEFRISQHESFLEHHDPSVPNAGQSHPSGRYCFLLRRAANTASFVLHSLACENCDNRLGRYTCDITAVGDGTPIAQPVDTASPPSSSGSAHSHAGSGFIGDGNTQQLGAVAHTPTNALANDSDTKKTLGQTVAHTLGLSINTTAPKSQLKNDVPRQVFAEIMQKVVHIKQAGVDIRCLSVTLPKVYDDLSRSVWCPRNRRGSAPGASPRPVVSGTRASFTSPFAAQPHVSTRASFSEEAGKGWSTDYVQRKVSTDSAGPSPSGSPAMGVGMKERTVPFTIGPEGLPLPPGVTGSPRTTMPSMTPLARSLSASLADSAPPIGLPPPALRATSLKREDSSSSLQKAVLMSTAQTALAAANGKAHSTGAAPEHPPGTPQPSSPTAMTSARSPHIPGFPGAFPVSKAAADVPTPTRKASSETQALAAARRGGADYLALDNRLPEWNDDLNSLTMKFLGGRIADSSSKNFLMERVEDSPASVLENMATQTEGGSSSRRTPCLQFGKLKAGRFSCDYRFPLCPAQAFGVLLSAFQWVVATKSDE